MASSVLKMQAASQGIQPSTSSSKGHWLTLVSPSPWSLSAWLTMEGGRMAWLWAPGTKVGAWCGTQQLWTLVQGHYKDSARQAGFVATKKKLRSQNAKNIMTSKAITTFNQWQLRPLVCMASPLPLFEWSFEETCWCVWRPQGAPVAPPASIRGCRQGKCCQHWLVVCKFDLILPVLFLVAAFFNVLTTITACHLPLYQCVAIAFWILVLSVRFIVPSIVQCYLVHWLNILSIAWPMMRVQCGFVFNIAWNLWGH